MDFMNMHPEMMGAKVGGICIFSDAIVSDFEAADDSLVVELGKDFQRLRPNAWDNPNGGCVPN